MAQWAETCRWIFNFYFWLPTYVVSLTRWIYNMKDSVTLSVQKHETFYVGWFRSHQSIWPHLRRHFRCRKHHGKCICPCLYMPFCRVQGRWLTVGRLQRSPAGFLRICSFTLHFESEQTGAKWKGGSVYKRNLRNNICNDHTKLPTWCTEYSLFVKYYYSPLHVSSRILDCNIKHTMF